MDITGKTIECKELGFSVVIPPGSVNYGVTVSVCCSFKQQLQPPGDYEFVSPVYILHTTAGITFLEEVELSVRHWAKVNNDTRLQFALLAFPVGYTEDSTSILEPHDGGTFFPHHGTIKTKHFSRWAIIRRLFSSVRSLLRRQPGDTADTTTETRDQASCNGTEIQGMFSLINGKIVMRP